MRLSAAAIATWILFSPPEEEAPAEPPPLQLNPAPEPEGFTEVPDPYAEEVDEPPKAEPQPPARVEPEPRPEVQPDLPPSPEPELQPKSAGPGRRSPLGIKRPPVWPPTWFSFGLGGSYNSFSLGAGVTHFVIPYVGVGLELRNDVIFNSPTTFNSFAATPVVTLLVLPRRNVTPLLRGGFGLNVFSAGLGVYGQFLGGGGVLFRLLKRYSAELGLDVVGNVPRDKFFDNFSCRGGGQGCWLNLRPSVGFGVSFGGPR